MFMERAVWQGVFHSRELLWMQEFGIPIFLMLNQSSHSCPKGELSTYSLNLLKYVIFVF